MSCKATKEIYTEMCLKWKASEFCNLANSDTFDFTLGFDVFHDDYVKYFVYNFLYLLRYNRENLKYFILQLSKCIYIRILTAKFKDNIIHKPACENYVKTTCKATCNDNPPFHQLLKEVENSQTNTTQSSMYQFQLFLCITIISWIGMTVVVTIADAICFTLLG